MLTPQFYSLTVLFGVCSWLIGHQASHCAAFRAGHVNLSYPLALIMGLQTFFGMIFLAWFAYMDGPARAAELFAFSFVVRLALVQLERVLGLTDRAWAISVTGLVIVPVLLISLVALVLHPITNDHYFFVAFVSLASLIGSVIFAVIACWLIWVHLVQPLFFPKYSAQDAAADTRRGKS